MPPKRKAASRRPASTTTSTPSDIVYERWLDSFPLVSLQDAPAKWTEEWERFLLVPKPSGLAEFYLRSRLLPGTEELLLSCYRGSYRDVCRMQHELSLTACNISAHSDFDKAWLGWSIAERRQFLAQAILRGVGFSDQFNAARAYCREVSIAFLETSLLDVLKHCLLEDLAEIPKAPIIYPIEFANHIDEKVLPPGQGLMLRYERLTQTQIICSVLCQALCVFLGDGPLQAGSIKGDLKIKNMDIRPDVKKAYKALSAACEHCRKMESKTQKMQICARCKTIGRNMPYCSRECVKADWPRHKIICGKPLTVETAASTAVVVNPATGHGQAPNMIVASFTPPPPRSRACSIRPCTGGYKRSAALIRQVLLLQQYPAIDYFLCVPARTGNLIYIVLADEAVSARFCAARDDVMSTGNEESLEHVVQTLVQSSRGFIDSGKYAEEYLVEQLQKEYGVSLSFSPI